MSKEQTKDGLWVIYMDDGDEERVVGVWESREDALSWLADHTGVARNSLAEDLKTGDDFFDDDTGVEWRIGFVTKMG